jgi:hypothetical protein
LILLLILGMPARAGLDTEGSGGGKPDNDFDDCPRDQAINPNLNGKNGPEKRWDAKALVAAEHLFLLRC